LEWWDFHQFRRRQHLHPGANSFRLSYDGPTNSTKEVTLTVVVPEPTAAGLLLTAALGLLARRRRAESLA